MALPDGPEAGEREEAEDGPAHYVLVRHTAPDARVDRDAGVVSHDEGHAVRHHQVLRQRHGTATALQHTHHTTTMRALS